MNKSKGGLAFDLLGPRLLGLARLLLLVGSSRENNLVLGGCNLLELVLVNQTGATGGITNDDTLLLTALDEGLVEAADAIADNHKVKSPFVKDVTVFGCELDEAHGKLVVVVLLLDGVVESRVAEIFGTIGN